jgi:hypothetical protein
MPLLTVNYSVEEVKALVTESVKRAFGKEIKSITFKIENIYVDRPGQSSGSEFSGVEVILEDTPPKNVTTYR